MEENRKYGKVFDVLKGEDVQTAVIQNSKVVIDFTAKWCNPCKQLAPILDDMASKYQDILFLKVDIDNSDCAELVEICEVKNLPTVQFYFNKEIQSDTVGFKKEEIISNFNNLINSK